MNNSYHRYLDNWISYIDHKFHLKAIFPNHNYIHQLHNLKSHHQDENNLSMFNKFHLKLKFKSNYHMCLLNKHRFLSCLDKNSLNMSYKFHQVGEFHSPQRCNRPICKIYPLHLVWRKTDNLSKSHLTKGFMISDRINRKRNFYYHHRGKNNFHIVSMFRLKVEFTQDYYTHQKHTQCYLYPNVCSLSNKSTFPQWRQFIGNLSNHQLCITYSHYLDE